MESRCKEHGCHPSSNTTIVPLTMVSHGTDVYTYMLQCIIPTCQCYIHQLLTTALTKTSEEFWHLYKQWCGNHSSNYMLLLHQKIVIFAILMINKIKYHQHVEDCKTYAWRCSALSLPAPIRHSMCHCLIDVVATYETTYNNSETNTGVCKLWYVLNTIVVISYYL